MRTNKRLEHIEDENLRLALEHSRDGNAYPDIFPEDYGMDFHSEDHPDWFAKKKDPCEITLKISSYRGISFNAIHFYGEICIHHLDIVSVEGGAEKFHHRGLLNIELVRVITEQMIKEDEERWHAYIPGCTTTAFDTVDEIIEIAKKIITARVPWFNIDDLKIDHDYYDVDVRRYR